MLPSHLWITRYCKRALQHRPELAQTTVIRRAVAAYPYANGMGPEEAAELYSSLSELRDGARAVARPHSAMR